MSGKTYEDYSSSLSRRTKSFSSDPEVSSRAYAESAGYVAKAKAEVLYKSASPRVERVHDDQYDASLVTNKITKPSSTVERIHVVLIDNSGSNRDIARHLRTSSGYLMSVLNTLDPLAQIAWMYVSDHCDDERMIQEIDFSSSDKKGDKALYSSLKHVLDASGGDAPEAFECALWDACKIDFGGAKTKHLYLVTDVVGHGMGMSGDEGCPLQRDWKTSVKKVYSTYDTFEVIGCGDDPEIGKLQAKFLKPERVPFDFIDLSSIKEFKYRSGITGNALLFLIARHTGMQGIELFLSFLYEKWIDDPIFGASTEVKAKEMIHRFGKYVEASEEEVKKVMDKVLI